MPPYVHYRPYLQADAAALLRLRFTQIIATTLLVPGVEPSAVDRCHYDVVVEAFDEAQLRTRITAIRARFIRHDNPAHRR